MTTTPTTPMRSTDYPTGDGMSFICNRWVFTGPEGYRVKRHDDGTFYVVHYTVAGETCTFCPRDMSEDDAHEYAARLAKR